MWLLPTLWILFMAFKISAPIIKNRNFLFLIQCFQYINNNLRTVNTESISSFNFVHFLNILGGFLGTMNYWNNQKEYSEHFLKDKVLWIKKKIFFILIYIGTRQGTRRSVIKFIIIMRNARFIYHFTLFCSHLSNIFQ